jgi:pimeloyl-ACP methyl ester carboxylesterase
MSAVNPPAAAPRAFADHLRPAIGRVLLALACLVALVSMAENPAAGAPRAQPDARTSAEPTYAGHLPIVADAKTAQCLDVVFIGARGSGEPFELKDTRGLGKTVFPALNTYASKMTGYRVGVHGVLYPARDTKLLTENTSPEKVKKFFSGLDLGTQAMWRFLQDRADACPGERYVLAGYSQGAMVTHRVMWLLADSRNNSLASRVDGLLLVADGDRIAREGGEHYGSSTNKELRDVGIVFSYPVLNIPASKVGARNKKVPDLFATGRFTTFGNVRWHSVCKSNDLICDFPGFARNEDRNADIHGTYATYNKMHDAAKQIAKASRLIKPQPRFGLASTTADTATVGEYYSWTMTPVGSKPPYSVSAGNGFPSTLTINSVTNTLSGVPTQAGTASLPVTVTDALNRSVEVTVTLNVTPAEAVPTTTPTLTPTPNPPPASVTLPAAAYYDDYRIALSSFYPADGTWVLIDGALPPGLALGSDGTIAGVPEQATMPTSYTSTIEHRSTSGTVSSTQVTIPHHGWDLQWGCAQVSGNVPGQPPYVGATGQLHAWFHSPDNIAMTPTVDRIGTVRLNGVDYPLQAGPGATPNIVALHLDYDVIYDLKVFVGGKLYLHDSDIRTGLESQCTIVDSFFFPFTD